jgi:hypothetical protein
MTNCCWAEAVPLKAASRIPIPPQALAIRPISTPRIRFSDHVCPLHPGAGISDARTCIQGALNYFESAFRL